MGSGASVMKICVFGLWHLGSVTAACLANLRHQVIGLDFQHEIINDFLEGKAPIFEPGLNELISDGIQYGTLQFTTDAQKALKDAEVLWVTIDTPVNDQDEADVSFVMQNFEKVLPKVEDDTLIIFSSQILVGCTRSIIQKFTKEYPGKNCFFAYSPENLRLGKAINVFLNPDRIIIGTLPGEKEKFLPLFKTISERLEWMGLESAEMTKHAINAFLAISIVFANEIATICEQVGAQAKEVERGLKSEERIGPKAYLGPGNAYSGGTLGRDVRFLQKISDNIFFPSYLLHAVTQSNDYHKTWIQRKCQELFENLSGTRILVLGLTYKPGTDTLRRSLSIELCKWLKEQGSDVTAFDPAITDIPKELSRFFHLTNDIHSSIQLSDCIIVATEWPLFKDLSLDEIAHLNKKVIIDPSGFLRNNCKDLHNMKYYSVGRANK